MASTVTELLRRRFGGKKEVDPLEGWEVGYRQSGGGDGIVADANFIRSPFLTIPNGCTEIYIYHPTNISVGNRMRYYNSNKEYMDFSPQYGINTSTAFNVPTNSAYLRVSFLIECIDNCYIKDDTNNQYIWKGKNV